MAKLECEQVYGRWRVYTIAGGCLQRDGTFGDSPHGQAEFDSYAEAAEAAAEIEREEENR